MASSPSPNRAPPFGFTGWKSTTAAVLGLLALAGWLGRRFLEQGVVAGVIWRANPFMPPPEVERMTQPARAWAQAGFSWDLAGFRLARNRQLRLVDPELKPLVAEIARRQKAGENMQYSMHLYREIRWRLNFTSDLAPTESKIAELRRSFSQPSLQEAARHQDPADGSWGVGLEPWYLRLYYSVEDGLAANSTPRLRLAFLDRINSPELLRARLDSLLRDNLAETGRFNREELDETFSALARLLFNDDGAPPYPFHPGLKDALRAFVDSWQNPATGCWGTWVQDRQGRTWKMDDVGMTFHVVSDLKGQVDHLDRMARRVLVLDRADFPMGIRMNGHYENHLNWDVVIILRYAWPSLDNPTRARARAAISRYLTYCLTQTLRPDGSFRTSDLDDTAGDATYYGVHLLSDAGYFSRRKRFWTDESFPDAEAVKRRILASIETVGLEDPEFQKAYRTLGGDSSH